jgi:hypothetical protein
VYVAAGFSRPGLVSAPAISWRNWLPVFVFKHVDLAVGANATESFTGPPRGLPHIAISWSRSAGTVFAIPRGEDVQDDCERGPMRRRSGSPTGAP